MFAYSIVYWNNGVECAIDWDWNIKNQWAISEKEGVQWGSFPSLDDKAYRVLLEHFGLTDFAEEFPL